MTHLFTGVVSTEAQAYRDKVKLELAAKTLWESQQTRILVTRPVPYNSPTNFYVKPWEFLPEEIRMQYRDDARAVLDAVSAQSKLFLQAIADNCNTEA